MLPPRRLRAWLEFEPFSTNLSTQSGPGAVRQETQCRSSGRLFFFPDLFDGFYTISCLLMFQNEGQIFVIVLLPAGGAKAGKHMQI